MTLSTIIIILTLYTFIRIWDSTKTAHVWLYCVKHGVEEVFIFFFLKKKKKKKKKNIKYL